MQSNSLAPIGVGVLGATGYIGAPYRAEMRDCDSVRIVALAARRRHLLDAAAREDGAALATDDWRAVVDHPDVNFVVVATPDALHHEAVLAAAAARKHLFCEKPVALNASQAREMLDAARTAGNLAHFVPFWTRWSPGFVKVRELVQDGALGKVRAAIYRWHNPRPANMPLTWRDNPELSSAGSIADVGSHAYDVVRWILGAEAKRVLAHAETITPTRLDAGELNLTEALERGARAAGNTSARKGGTPDYASIAWEFEDGTVGTLVLSHATYLRRGLAPELELHGTEASLAVDRFHGTVTMARPDGSMKLIERVTPGFDLGNRFQKWVFPAVRAVMNGAKQDELDVPSLADGWRVQRFTDAAVESSRRGAWVTV